MTRRESFSIMSVEALISRPLVVSSDEHTRFCPVPGIPAGPHGLVLERLEDISNSYEVPVSRRWLDIHKCSRPKENDQQTPDATVSGRVPNLLLHAWIGAIVQIGGEGRGEGMLDDGVQLKRFCEEP